MEIYYVTKVQNRFDSAAYNQLHSYRLHKRVWFLSSSISSEYYSLEIELERNQTRLFNKNTKVRWAKLIRRVSTDGLNDPDIFYI